MTDSPSESTESAPVPEEMRLRMIAAEKAADLLRGNLKVGLTGSGILPPLDADQVMALADYLVSGLPEFTPQGDSFAAFMDSVGTEDLGTEDDADEIEPEFPLIDYSAGPAAGVTPDPRLTIPYTPKRVADDTADDATDDGEVDPRHG